MPHRTLVDVARRLVHAAEHATESPAADLLAALDVLGEARRLVDAAAVQIAGEVERRSTAVAGEGLAQSLGDRTASVTVARVAGVSAADASIWCRVGAATSPRVTLTGEALPPTRPALADSLRCGDISAAAADQAISALTAVEPHASSDDVGALEARLVALAPEFSLREFTRLCRRVPDTFDPDGAEPREDLLRARSGLTISRTPDGLTRWVVTMHPEAAGFLTAALDARTAPRRRPSFTATDNALAPDSVAAHRDPARDPDRLVDPTADDRTLAQRRLDALVGIARESLEHDPGQLSGTAVTMNVTISLAELQSGVGSALIDGVDAPISAATARRLAAGASLIPVILGGPSEPLDLGRAARLFSPAQRRALALRDGGCLWPGCSAPPGWCEVAHVTAWAAGGPTDLRNGALLCPFHHRRLDHDGWQLLWRADTPYLVPPGHIDATRTPLRAGRPPQVVPDLRRTGS